MPRPSTKQPYRPPRSQSRKGKQEPLLHASLCALPTLAGYLGVLLLGPAGAGKTTALLRLLGRGGWLISDDQVILHPKETSLWGYAPKPLSGLMEVAGLGLISRPHLGEVRIALAVELENAPSSAQRLPEESFWVRAGISLPKLSLRADDPAFAEIVEEALTARARLLLPLPPGTKDASGQASLLYLISGLAGAGRTTALKHLEDLGFTTIDNLPPALLANTFAEQKAQPGSPKRLAVGFDGRLLAHESEEFFRQLAKLSKERVTLPVLFFLECADEVLERRFKETRHRHPFFDEAGGLAEAIALEREALLPIRARAHQVIDSTALSPAGLRALLAARFSGQFAGETGRGLSVLVQSFSYRGGLPREADCVFDVRFLPNPHYLPDLQPLDGRDPRVAAYVLAEGGRDEFLARLYALLSHLLPGYVSEGKSYLTLAFGCTGGQHRSVAVAEAVATWLSEQGLVVRTYHRDRP